MKKILTLVFCSLIGIGFTQANTTNKIDYIEGFTASVENSAVTFSAQDTYTPVLITAETELKISNIDNVIYQSEPLLNVFQSNYLLTDIDAVKTYQYLLSYQSESLLNVFQSNYLLTDIDTVKTYQLLLKYQSILSKYNTFNISRYAKWNLVDVKYLTRNGISKYEIFNIQPISPLYGIMMRGLRKEALGQDDSFEYSIITNQFMRMLKIKSK